MKDAKILIVEGEVLVARSLEKLLRQFGYSSVSLVTKGGEAIAKAAEDKPDLILMDIKLRNTIDGIQTAERIQQQTFVPIIYLTAYSDEETVNRAKLTEPFTCLTKPVNEQELRSNIEMALYKTRLDAQLRESEERYRFASSVREGIVLQEASGKIVTWNESAEKIFGLKAEEAIGQTSAGYPWSTIHEDGSDFPGDTHPSMHTLRTGEPCTDVMMGIKRPDGDIVWVLVNTRPLFKEGGQTPYAVAISFKDITECRRMVAALRESKERLEAAMRAADIGLWDWNLATNKVVYSPEWKHQIGYGEDEIADDFREWESRVHPEDLERMMSAIRQFIRDPWPNYEAEFRFRHKNGSYRWIFTRAAIIKDKDGRPVRMLGSHVDITARKLMEDTLRQNESIYRQLYEQSPVAYQSLDENGNLLMVNSAWLKALGYSREEVIGKWFGDFLAGDGPELFRQRFPLFKQRKETHGVEFEIKCADGTVIVVLFDGVIQSSPDGAFVRTHCVFSNITKRRQAEEERMLLTAAITQAAEAIAIADQNGTIQYVNPGFEHITGYSRAEAEGQNFRLLKSGRQDAAFYKELWDTISRGEVWRGCITNKRKDGRLYEEETTISSVKNSAGKITNYVAVKRDVTRELQMEEHLRQSQKLEAIGTLAGGIAHDFNNILAGIINYTELALDEIPENFYFRRHLEESLKLCAHARDLIKSLILFSRPLTQAFVPLSLDATIKDFMNLLQVTIPSSIEVAYDLRTTGSRIAGDAIQIHQVLMNICKNAADAMREQGGVLKIELSSVFLNEEDALQYHDLPPGAYCELKISDTGTGIDPAVIDRIFEPFFTTKEADKGTGMGLAVVHGIIKNHKGHISVASEPGRGTTFTILLPETEGRPEVLEQYEENIPAGSERILLIDDEKSIIVTVKMFLENIGYKVTAAMNGLEALELFRAAPGDYDLIITDQTMPHLSGTLLAQEVLKIRPEVPVILTTGFSDSIDDDKAASLGIKVLLMKPYRRSDIARQIRDILDAQATPLQG